MANVTEKVAEKLGGYPVLGLKVRSAAELARIVSQRLPLAALEAMTSSGISEKEIDRLVIPARTRRHRAQRHEPLTVQESDTAVRIVRIQTLAEDVFEDHGKANTWLRRPLTALSGKAPLDIAETEAGARVVETILAKLAWGAAA